MRQKRVHLFARYPGRRDFAKLCPPRKRGGFTKKHERELFVKPCRLRHGYFIPQAIDKEKH